MEFYFVCEYFANEIPNPTDVVVHYGVTFSWRSHRPASWPCALETHSQKKHPDTKKEFKVFLIVMLVDYGVMFRRNMKCKDCLQKFPLVLNATHPVALQIIVTWRHGGHIGVQNKKTAAMLMYRKNPLGTERFSQVKTSFCSTKFA